MPNSTSDVLLIARVKALHNKLAGLVLKKRGLDVTAARLKKSLKWSTVSIVETNINGRIIRIVTTNDSGFYKLLQEGPANLRLPNEIIGSRPTDVTGPIEPHKRSKRQTIHAEQLGMNDAKRMGGKTGKIATSNPGCTDQCISLINDEFPEFSHLNPKSTAPTANINEALEAQGIPEPISKSKKGNVDLDRGYEGKSIGSRGTSPDVTSPGRISDMQPSELSGAKLQRPSADFSPDIRVKRSATTFRFVRGFILDMLVDIAINLFVNYFERRVNEVTERLIRDNWKRKVYPKIEPYLQIEMKLSADGNQPKRFTRIYRGLDWTVIMQELKESFSDDVVLGVKMLAGDPRYGEVFFGFELDTKTEPHFRVTSQRLGGELIERKRDPKQGDLWRYKYRQWFLVHDAIVLKIANDLKMDLQKKEIALQNLDQQYLSLDPSRRYASDILQIDRYLKEYHFQKAYREITILIGKLNLQFGLGANSLVANLKLLAQDCANIITKTFTRMMVLDADQVTLLNALLGTNSILKN